MFMFLWVWLLLFVASAWGETPPPAGGLHLRRHRANHLVGTRVENLDGEKIGRVENFLVDRPSGKVQFVLISTGGVLGIGSRTRPVPAAALNMFTSKAGVLSMDITRKRWHNAPEFRNDNLKSLGSVHEIKTLWDYYLSPQASSTLRIQDGKRNSRSQLSTGTEDSNLPPLAPLSLFLGSEIIGKSVVDQQNTALGQITDLIVEFPPKGPAFAVMTTGRALRKKHNYAVSLEVLNTARSDKLVLGIDPRSFEHARSFDEAGSSGDKAEGVYLYSERKAPDTSQGGASLQDHLTPLQQSESQDDLRITQRIRQELIHHEALTFTAKNVKIITINGKVVLKGAVNTAKEKEIIQIQAQKIAGTQNVDNQLAVFQKR